MSDGVDNRREGALRDELLRRATAVFGTRADAIEPGEVMHAILSVAARIGDEVTGRLEQVPQKQAANFYAAMGIGRSPAMPATLPVSMTLGDGGPEGLFVPAGTKLQADAAGGSVIFETLTGLDLVRGAIARLCAIDVTTDHIFLAPGPAQTPVLPYPVSIARRLVSDVGAGASVLQIEPATGLAPLAVLQIGDPEREFEHIADKVADNLVTISPPLDSVFKAGESVGEVTAFAPWSKGARNHQSHQLYLGHATMLDVPSPATIFVSGIISQQTFEWRWFGKSTDADAAEWQLFSKAEIDADGRWRLEKPEGKVEKSAVAGDSMFWLRATLKQDSQGVETAKSIGIAVAASAACEAGETEVNANDFAGSVGFEAVAVTTPVVIGKPFHPFGREPRLYDSFYIGCKEAFGKAGARVWLSFSFGGAELGRMAIVNGGVSKEIFAVGTDGLLYRAVLAAKSFEPVPMPPELNGVGVAPQARVAARIDRGLIRIALAGKGCVYTASFNAVGTLAADKIVWRKLGIGAADPAGEAVTLHLTPGHVLAQWRSPEAGAADRNTSSLIDWELAQPNPDPQLTEKVLDLIPVQGEGVDAALRIDVDHDGTLKLSAIHNVLNAPTTICDLSAQELPETLRTAWATTSGVAEGLYTIGGYADGHELWALQVSPHDVAKKTVELDDVSLLPIAFEPPYGGGNWPVAVIATAEPTRIVLDAEPPRKVTDGVDIGFSTNAMRHLVTFGGWTVVQHPDRGLYFRADDGAGHSLGNILVEGDYRLVADANVLPDGATLLADKTGPRHKGFDVLKLAGGPTLLRPFVKKDAIPALTDQQNWQVDLTPLELGAGGGKLSLVRGGTIELENDPSGRTDTSILIYVEGTNASGAIRSIWTLTRASGADKWRRPPRFPPSSSPYRWQPLLTIDDSDDGGPIDVTLNALNTRSWFETASAKFEELTRHKDAHSFYDSSITVAASAGMVLGTTTAFPLPLRAIDRRAEGNDSAPFLATAADWDSLGPNQPANPDLSWEYWNGSAWWNLDGPGFHDATADLQVKGAIEFTVPGDLSETDVGGRTNRWIRARLIGGDYGQARIIIGDDEHPPQSVTRDLSSIRAPYVTSLKINYCAMAARPPERIVTEDNLGMIDQTNANDSGLSVRVFSPVSTVLDPPRPEALATAGGDGACCEVWVDPTTTPPPPVSTLPHRALMIGLDQPPKGDAVSLYVDAEPTGGEIKLAAFAFKAGRFASIDVLSDDSLGMSEPGAIRLRIPEPLDLAHYFGTTAYWIALGPSRDAELWSPRLRGLYLNTVTATSVETRNNESIGASTGAPDQRFRLVTAPVAADTLDLWVAEPVGGEEKAALGALDAIQGMAGPWVRWTQQDEWPTSETSSPGRYYTLDPQIGEVRFGNGRNALIPPMGSAIFARAYQHVIGQDANGVAAGDQLQPISPIAGVDKVLALDPARGGVDAETLEKALGRAPVKMRGGDWLTTLTDLEEFVNARLNWVAQARATNRRGRIRLVVAGRAEKLTPLPSALRGVRETIATRATYGVTTRLDVVAPRLLPVEVAVSLELDVGADAATQMAQAREAIARFFDHETGGHDGRGWPIGVTPVADDIAAALAELTEQAVLRDISVTRKDSGAALPPALSGDVLVRVAAADIVVQTVTEAVS